MRVIAKLMLLSLQRQLTYRRYLSSSLSTSLGCPWIGDKIRDEIRTAFTSRVDIKEAVAKVNKPYLRQIYHLSQTCASRRNQTAIRILTFNTNLVVIFAPAGLRLDRCWTQGAPVPRATSTA